MNTREETPHKHGLHISKKTTPPRTEGPVVVSCADRRQCCCRHRTVSVFTRPTLLSFSGTSICLSSAGWRAPAGTEEGCFERASRFIHRSRTDKLKCIGGAVWCCGDVTPPGPDAAVYTKLNKCAPIRPPAGRFTSFGRLYPWRVSPQYLPLDVVVGVVHVIEVEEQGVPTGQQQELVQVVKLGSANGMGQHVPALKVHRRFDSSTGSNDYLSNVLFSY